MFTGLIQDVGTLQSIQQSSAGATLEIATALETHDFELGESIACDGVCLTVTALKGQRFCVDCSPETLRCTSLGQRKAGDPIHLERALRMGDRLGGHLVSGHVDGIGTVRSVKPEGNAILIEVLPPPQLLRYMIAKGSIAIDGVSLTINHLSDDSFDVAIIPHTQEKTHLGNYRSGTPVNLEVDQVGKYIERMVLPWKRGEGGGIHEAFLREHGFLP